MEERVKNKNQLIGCYGLDCETCDARIATITNDNTLREKTATRWTKLNVNTFGAQYQEYCRHVFRYLGRK